jgi:(p)ppGpp synthase/HD superfamily hydrolase
MLDQVRSFALAAHGSQMYGTQPYAVHLDAVVGLLSPYGTEAQIIGYLHDVVEDTAVTESDIRHHFGPRQAAYRAGLCEPLWLELDALLAASPPAADGA